MLIKKAVATASKSIESYEAMTTDNQICPDYNNHSCMSKRKPREPLSEQITNLLVHLQSPFLTKPERKQGNRLFESSLRRCVAVKGVTI